VLDFGEGYTDYEDFYDDDWYDHPEASAVQKSSMADKSYSIPGSKRRMTSKLSKRKKRKLESTEDIPELSLGESMDSVSFKPLQNRIVVWKTKETFIPRPVPIIAHDEGDKVALLKDWRERFKSSSNLSTNVSAAAKHVQHSTSSTAPSSGRAPHNQAGKSGRVMNGAGSRSKLAIHPDKEDLVQAPKERVKPSTTEPERQNEKEDSAPSNKRKTSIPKPLRRSPSRTPSTNSSASSRKRKAEAPSEADDEFDIAPSKKTAPDRRTERVVRSRTSSRGK
jgi:hypothetical protein